MLLLLPRAMALRLRKFFLGVSSLPRPAATQPHYVRCDVVDNCVTGAARNWKRATAVMRNQASGASPIATCSAISRSWSRPGGVIVHLASNFHSCGVCSSAAASGDSFLATEGDAGSVSERNEGLGERDEEVSVQTLAAIREFDIVNEDLEAESQRNADVARTGRRQKPTCYYFTQGLCTLVRLVSSATLSDLVGVCGCLIASGF